MKSRFELFNSTYKNYAEELYSNIREETYGEDIGQTSWITADEYRDMIRILGLSPGKHVLEIASGSGGPAVFMVEAAGCRLTGIDINENGIINSQKLALQNGLSEQMNFLKASGADPLPFASDSFDVVICLDSINHLNNRREVFKEFKRVLKHGGQLLFTDPVVITGAVSNEELAARSSIGFFIFSATGVNEHLLNEAGFKNIQLTDVTNSMAEISLKWCQARERWKRDLLQIEEAENFEGLQTFFKTVHKVASEHRMIRFLYTCEK